jgi:hypothetical protein
LGHALQIELLFAALLAVVLMVSSGSFRSKLKVFVSKHFFSFRYDYREEWLRFTRTLAAENSPHGLQESAIQALANLVESPGGALWLRREEDESFHPVSRWNMGAVDAIEPAGGPLADFLKRTGWVIDLKEYASDGTRYPGLTLPAWMTAVPRHGSWFLCCRTDLIGFLILSTPRAAIELNWELRDFVEDSEPAGGKLPRSPKRRRGSARSPQIRRVQPDVGVRRARPQEPGSPALVDAAKCGAPP